VPSDRMRFAAVPLRSSFTSTRTRGNMTFRLLVIVVLAGLVVLFLIQNVGVVEIRFLFWSFSLSRSLLLFLVLCAGFAAGWLWHSFTAHRAKKRASA
jgi:uncharacterized integral membrane protein